jgi:ribosome-associated protein YbcJ (S4-like RNA binding protein)
MSLNILENQLHRVLDKLSNGQTVPYEESWIEEAGEMFKDTLRKQMKPREDKFRIRMSNVGRPLCQLQREKEGAPKSKNPYNNIVRFMLGDATEVLVEFYLKLAGVNITGGKAKVKLDVGDTTILGENDVEIDNKVYDTKSSSPWAYEHKWSQGWEGVAKDDAFGYVPQLLGYSDASGLEPGGWIVLNKSTGEIQIVEAEFTGADKEKIRDKISNNVNLIATDAPFEKCFEPQDEYFRKQLTPNKRLAMNCTFCSYTNTCWPDAKYRPQTHSKAQNPRYHWYAEYDDDL